MKNFLKIVFVYLITFAISIVLSAEGRLTELNCFKWGQFEILILNLIIMIVLFRLLKVEIEGLVIFFIIMTLLITMASIDSTIMFGPGAKYGVYSCNTVVPDMFWAISFLLSYPFSGIITPLIFWNYLSKARYIVPLGMGILTFIIPKVSTMQLHKERDFKS